jgi:hypothetical protein
VLLVVAAKKAKTVALVAGTHQNLKNVDFFTNIYGLDIEIKTLNIVLSKSFFKNNFRSLNDMKISSNHVKKTFLCRLLISVNICRIKCPRWVPSPTHKY